MKTYFQHNKTFTKAFPLFMMKMAAPPGKQAAHHMERLTIKSQARKCRKGRKKQMDQKRYSKAEGQQTPD